MKGRSAGFVRGGFLKAPEKKVEGHADTTRKQALLIAVRMVENLGECPSLRADRQEKAPGRTVWFFPVPFVSPSGAVLEKTGV